MHQSVKLNDAIWRLQLVISSPLIHALGDPSQAPTRIQIRAPSMSMMRGGWLKTELSLHLWFKKKVYATL